MELAAFLFPKLRNIHSNFMLEEVDSQGSVFQGFSPILGRNLSKPLSSSESRLGGVEPKFDEQIVINYHSLAVFVFGMAPKKSSIWDILF